MRKAAIIIFMLMFIISLSCNVFAATGIAGGNYAAVFSSNGSCQVSLDLTVHMEAGASDLRFPVPGSARSITINGTSARTSRSGDTLNIKLSSLLGNMTGDFPIRIQYTLPNLVNYNDAGKLILTLPILSGFNHPIKDLKFQITLPGDFPRQPDFSSGYYQQTIESNLDYEIAGSVLSGIVTKELKDRETLLMTMEVSEDMFPQNPVKQWRVGVENIIMIVLASFALLYWIFYLRSAPFIARRSTMPPEGYTAGELSGLFTGYGNDLTMMVLSWAQLGYILIHVQDSGRVTLHKRMDMGNERDPEEVRIFRKLFAKRRYVDGTGYHYANLYQKTAVSSDNRRDLYKRTSGNPKVFRILCAGIGLLGGISLGIAIVGSALLGVLLIALLAVLGGISAWVMQDWVKGLHLHNKRAMYIGLGLAALWCLLGLMAGIFSVTACVAVAQLLCGLMCAYGGRRTILGRQTMSQVLGFRRFLKKLSPEDAYRIRRADPDYFFTMAPYAMALGVGKPFAASFRGKRFSSCAYLTTGMDGHMTALEWYQVMDRAVQALDARHKRLLLERLTGKQ